MYKSKDKKILLSHLKKKFQKAKKIIHTADYQSKSFSEKISISADADIRSLSYLKKYLTDACWEHIQYYKLDLSSRDIRMFQHTINAIELYWDCGLFIDTELSRYTRAVDEFKRGLYRIMGLTRLREDSVTEIPVLPHVMLGTLRLYYEKIKMPEETIKQIFTFFEGKRLPKTNHKHIKEIESICRDIAIELQNNNYDFFSNDEKKIYPIVLKYFDKKYFIINKRC